MQGPCLDTPRVTDMERLLEWLRQRQRRQLYCVT
jgi:hypothetical protein